MKNDMRPSPQHTFLPFPLTGTKMKLFFAFLTLIVSSLIIFVVFLVTAYPASQHLIPQSKTGQPPGAHPALLPGQQRWKENVSSFLFGTNDTQEWVPNNVETS